MRRLREDRDWSQAELGRRVGLGQSRVAAIEATGSVTIDQADAFAAAFGVPVEALLYAEPPATKAVQARRLLRMVKVMEQALATAYAEIDRFLEEEPGKLGATVTADRIEPHERAETGE